MERLKFTMTCEKNEKLPTHKAHLVPGRMHQRRPARASSYVSSRDERAPVAVFGVMISVTSRSLCAERASGEDGRCPSLVATDPHVRHSTVVRQLCANFGFAFLRRPYTDAQPPPTADRKECGEAEHWKRAGTRPSASASERKSALFVSLSLLLVSGALRWTDVEE